MAEYHRANRQYVAMTSREVWDFVGSQTKMIVAFAREDGYAHATPVWFVDLDGRIYFRTLGYKAKAKLAKGARACCLFEAGERYVELKGVVIWGRCAKVVHGRRSEVVEEAMSKKYRELRWEKKDMPADWVNRRKAESSQRVYFEVTPEIVSSWDNNKLAMAK